MLKTFNKILPLYLTLIVNYPLLLGVLINPSLVSSRLITINLLWLASFVILFRIFKSNWLYRFGVIIYSTMSFIEGLHWIILNGPLSHSSLFVISATNFQESTEFLGVKTGLSIALILPLFWLIYKAWRYQPNYEPFKNVLFNYLQGAIILTFGVFIIENTQANRLIRKGIPHFPKVAITFQSETKLFKQAKETKATKFVEAEATDNQQTVVLIIGESANRNHWQLYGNKTPTTPLLSSRNDIYYFDNVISSHSNTIASVLESLTEAALDNNIKRTEGTDIFDVFHSAGYSTYWISNQAPVGIWENLITIFANKANQSVYTNLGSSSSMESTLTRSYDELLFEPTIRVLKEPDSLKLIVLHTMGSHTSYGKRYPSSFNQFKGKDKKSKTIAEYHNTILYTDYVLDSLLKIIESNTKNAVVVYASDHGQNVYDEGDIVGHSYSGKIPKPNVEIPYFYWFSTEYMKNIDLELIKSRKNEPYVTDNLFHTLIDLAKIRTPILKPEASFVNPDFDNTRKRILEDEKDYDEE